MVRVLREEAGRLLELVAARVQRKELEKHLEAAQVLEELVVKEEPLVEAQVLEDVLEVASLVEALVLILAQNQQKQPLARRNCCRLLDQCLHFPAKLASHGYFGQCLGLPAKLASHHYFDHWLGLPVSLVSHS